MITRDLKVSTTAIKFAYAGKAMQKEWVSEIREADSTESLRNTLEDLFMERLPKSLVERYEERLMSLDEEERLNYLEEMMERYERLGFLGFNTVAYQPLLRIA